MCHMLTVRVMEMVGNRPSTDCQGMLAAVGYVFAMSPLHELQREHLSQGLALAVLLVGNISDGERAQ